VKNAKVRVAESKTDTRQKKNVWEERKKLPHPKEKEKNVVKNCQKGRPFGTWIGSLGCTMSLKGWQ